MNCPCLDRCFHSESTHSPLPDSWERLFAPCKCSFIAGSTRGYEESCLGSEDLRWKSRCPADNSRNCSLRILYINHVTGETTLHCSCATCSPDWKTAPCLNLGSLFAEDEPSLLDENSDDLLIPAQDLTRMGKSCWRLGDLFDVENLPEGWQLDVDPVIPDQDVGLHIFDDIPGFALAKNHPPLTPAQSSPLTVDKPSVDIRDTPPVAPSHKSSGKMPQGCWTYFMDLILSLPTSVSTRSFTSLFVDYTITTSTHSHYDPPLPLSLGEAMEAFFGLVLSVLLVCVYECIGIYVYLKSFPSPPLFLSKLVGVVLLVVGLRFLKGNFGLV